MSEDYSDIKWVFSEDGTFGSITLIDEDTGWTVPMPDVVNQPPHYTSGSIEAIDYITSILSREELIGWYRGTIAKYTHRWRYKGGVEDLKKAQWYLDRLIKLMESE